MQIYNNSQNSRNQRSTRSCSYCRSDGHVVTECPHPSSDWVYFQKFEIPLKDPNCWANKPTTYGYAHWFRMPENWSSWYKECEKAVEKIQKAKAKAKNKKVGIRKPSKCGFCGSLHHNRKKCTEMPKIFDRFIQANRGWRQRFYDKVVDELGISLGTIVEVNKRNGWNKPDTTEIGIVKSINLDELSMFCNNNDENSNWRDRIDNKFRQPLKIVVTCGGSDYHLTFKDGLLKDKHGLLANNIGYYNNVTLNKVIARSETPLEPEWIEEGHEKAMEFLTKKYSFAKLKQYNVIKLLENIEEANKNAGI